MAEVPWIVRFVDKPDVGRVTRLDLNDEQTGGDVYVRPDGFSLGVGEVEVATAGSMLTEGEVVTASKRVNREITVPLAIVGGTPELATLLNALAREMDRPRNYLEFKPTDHTGESLFFAILPGSDFTEVDLDPDDYPAEKGAQVTLAAEPVGVGLPVTGSATVNNNPAAASNPQSLTLPTIKGDVPAPFNVTASGTALASGGATALLGVHTNPTTPGRILLQAETGTVGTDTTLQANSAAMSGAGSNFVRATFATAAFLFDRVSWSSLSATFGTYRMLVRVRKTAAGDVFTLRRRLTSIGGTEFTGPTRTYPATTNVGPHWVDLGVLDLPPGPTPPGVTSGVVGHLGVQAGRSSGAGSLDIDCVVLVPDKAGVIGQPEANLATVWHQWGSSLLAVGFNAEDDQVWTATGTNYGHSPTKRAGSLPKVRPGYTNHLTFMRHVGTLGGGTNKDVVSADDLTWTSTIDWSYRPHYQYVSAP